MSLYIALLRWTDKGIADLKKSPARVDAAKEAYKKAGGELKAIYLTMGQYDLVTIAEAPSDEVAARLGLSLGALGNVRSETLKAYSEADFRKIVASLP